MFARATLVLGLFVSHAGAQDTGRSDSPAFVADPGATLRTALELYRTQQYAEAAHHFVRYLEHDPELWTARKLLGLCYLYLQQPERALQELNAVAKVLPDDSSLIPAIRRAKQLLREQREQEEKRLKPEEIEQWVARAEKLIRENRAADAAPLLLRVLEDSPEHEIALRRQAEIYMGTGRFLEAAAFYGRLQRLGGRGGQEAKLQRARCLAWAQHYVQAMAEFEPYLEAVPDDQAARFDLAEVYRWAGRLEEAAATYLNVLKEEPANITARLGLAQSYAGLERYAAALEEYEAILRTDPGNQQAREGRDRALEETLLEKKRLAWVAQESGDYAESIRLLQDYACARPHEGETLLQLARLYTWAGELRRARESYEGYLSIVPDDRLARLELAELESWNGDYSSARASFERLLADEPADVRALAGILRCLVWSGQFEEAQRYHAQLEHVEPGHPLLVEVGAQLREFQRQTMRERAEQFEKKNDYLAAINAYREYLAEFGPQAEIEVRIPRLYAWNRRYDEAVQEYESYLMRHPEAESVRVELADVHRWRADYGSALQNYAGFLSSHPRHARGLFGNAEALFASSGDLFRVRAAYQQAAQAAPDDRRIQDRLREIGDKLRPVLQLPVIGMFDSDGLERVALQPRITFLLPAGYRLISLFHASSTHQDRLITGTTPEIDALNKRIGKLRATLRGARTGLRIERQQSRGNWGAEMQLGSFSDGRVSVAFAADMTRRVGEGGVLWGRFEHEEAAFELNTLASLAAGIVGDTWRGRYQQRLPAGFVFSSGYGFTHLSDSDRFGFADNLRHTADVRLSFERFRRFQPGYAYSVSSYRDASPLYFSPRLYQAHRFEYLIELGRGKRVQWATNGSLGLGRIDGVNTLEVTIAPQMSLQLPHGGELLLQYQFGRSHAGSFRRSGYTVHGFLFVVRIPIFGVRQ